MERRTGWTSAHVQLEESQVRKAIAVALAVGLLTGAMAAPVEAGKKKKKPKRVERVVEFDYVCPCPGFYQFGSATGTNFGGGPLAVGAESYIKITAEDASGTAVLVNVNQDTDGDGFNDPVVEVCATDEAPKEPAEINPGLEMRLFITTGTCEDGSPSVPVGGTLTITLSNLP